MSRPFRSRLSAALGIAFLLVLVALPASALAHERRTIANGNYDVSVGWDAEPAYQGEKNAASIRISEAGSNPGVPVEGAENSLKVRIRQGSTTREFPLRAVSGQKGYYVADILPTRDGEYQFTFVGSINGEAVNDTFDTADGKFSKVESAASLEFPPVEAEAQTNRFIALAAGALAVIAVIVAVARSRRPRRFAPVIIRSDQYFADRLTNRFA